MPDTTTPTYTPEQLMEPPLGDFHGFIPARRDLRGDNGAQTAEAWAAAFNELRTHPDKPNDILIRNFLRDPLSGLEYAEQFDLYAFGIGETALRKKWVTEDLRVIARLYPNRLISDDPLLAVRPPAAV